MAECLCRHSVLSTHATAHYISGWPRTSRISLSVERKNLAQRLYRSEGFQIADSSHRDSDTMVKDLAATPG